MITTLSGSHASPSVYALDCSGGPVIGSPLWMSCLQSDPVGGNNQNNGPMVLQNGVPGTSFNSPPPAGRVVFEGSGVAQQQDFITFYDSANIASVPLNGANIFSQPGTRPTASAGDCAVSADGSGLAQRCGTSIANYINSLPDGTSWLEQLTTTLKTFTVPVKSTVGQGTPPFQVASSTPVQNLTANNNATLQSCGSTTTCTHGVPPPLPGGQVVFGTLTIPSGGVGTLMGISPTFTSATSFNCVANDITNQANGVKAVPASGSSVTFTGVQSDTISYQCVGN